MTEDDPQYEYDKEFDGWLAGRSIGFNIEAGWFFVLPNTTQPVAMSSDEFQTFVGFLDGVDW